jgi:hypothetical protein
MFSFNCLNYEDEGTTLFRNVRNHSLNDSQTPEDVGLQQHHCENLKFRKFQFLQ